MEWRLAFPSLTSVHFVFNTIPTITLPTASATQRQTTFKSPPIKYPLSLSMELQQPHMTSFITHLSALKRRDLGLFQKIGIRIPTFYNSSAQSRNYRTRSTHLRFISICSTSATHQSNYFDLHLLDICPLPADDLKKKNRFFPEESSLVATPPLATEFTENRLRRKGVSLFNIMKGSRLWILFLVFGTALLCIFLSAMPGSDLAEHKNIADFTKPSRKLKSQESPHDESGDGGVEMYDYFPNDPVPSSKAAALRPGPIEHGTPLMPYIPKPEPPGPNDP
ncbi:hypothetical protein LXL04_008006 [Taraxacum kok-saghyz]